MTSFTRYRRRASMGAIVLFVTGFAMLIIGIVLTGLFASKEKKTETVQQPIADADLRSFDIVLDKKWTDYNKTESTLRKHLESDIKTALEKGLTKTRAASGKVNVQKVSISQVQKTADDKVRAYASAIYVAYDDGRIPSADECGSALEDSNGLMENATISAKPDPIQFCNNYENNNATTVRPSSTTPSKPTPSGTTPEGGSSTSSTKPATTVTPKVTTTTLPAVTTPASTPTTTVPVGSTQTTPETTVITSSAPTTTNVPSASTTTVPLTSTASPSTVPSSSASPTTPSETTVSTSTVTTPSSSTSSTTNPPTGSTASPTTPLSSTETPSAPTTVPSSSVPTTPSTQTSVEPTTPSEEPTTESTFEPSTTQESTTPYTGTTLKPVSCYHNASNVQQNVIVIYDMSNSSVISNTTLQTFISGIFDDYNYDLHNANIFQSLPIPFPDTVHYSENIPTSFANRPSVYQSYVLSQFLTRSAEQGSKINDALTYVNTHPFIRLTQRPRTLVIVSHGYDDIDDAKVTANELSATWNIVTVATGGANSTILKQLATNTSYSVEGGNLTDPANTSEKVREVLAGICSLPDNLPTTPATTTTPRPTTTTTTAAPTTTAPPTCVNQSIAFAFDMSGSYQNLSSTGMLLLDAIKQYGISDPRLSPAARGAYVPFPDSQDFVNEGGFALAGMNKLLTTYSRVVEFYYYKMHAEQQSASLYINDTLNLVLQEVGQFRNDKSVVLFLSNTDDNTISNGISVASTLKALNFDIFVVHVGNVSDACASIATDSDHCSLLPDLGNSTQVASVFDGIISLMLKKSPTLNC
uniref:VWFA domain-containing protein n=1 Tax=Panagrellus redivivus TaxID=6233 RepID=A0A7E4ZYW5_PANRE